MAPNAGGTGPTGLPGEDSNLGLVDQNHSSCQLDDPGLFGSSPDSTGKPAAVPAHPAAVADGPHWQQDALQPESESVRIGA